VFLNEILKRRNSLAGSTISCVVSDFGTMSKIFMDSREYSVHVAEEEMKPQ
jgi:hypothetical protein